MLDNLFEILPFFLYPSNLPKPIDLDLLVTEIQTVWCCIVVIREMVLLIRFNFPRNLFRLLDKYYRFSCEVVYRNNEKYTIYVSRNFTPIFFSGTFVLIRNTMIKIFKNKWKFKFMNLIPNESFLMPFRNVKERVYLKNYHLGNHNPNLRQISNMWPQFYYTILNMIFLIPLLFPAHKYQFQWSRRHVQSWPRVL